MLDFLDDVKHSGQKLDDFADSLNLAVAVDKRTIVEVQEELAAMRAAAAAAPAQPKKRSRDAEDEDSEMETAPKRRRVIVLDDSDSAQSLSEKS